MYAVAIDPGSLSESDGRLARGERTKRQIVEAYILLLRERRQLPTVAQIAERAGYSLRTMYLHFSDVVALSVAACDWAIRQGLSVPVGDKVSADRATRIRFQVEVRAENCERWLPLWRMLMHYRDATPDLTRRIAVARQLVYERMQLMYERELSTLSSADRRAVLISLEALTDYESWGRMRELHGMSIEEAQNVWIESIEKLLPPTPET